MYTLILTSGERKAFDWVGHRNSNGDEMSSILVECLGPDEEWSQDGEIVFSIPEHKAWEIARLAEQDGGYWTGFDLELVEKMQAFVDGIV